MLIFSQQCFEHLSKLSECKADNKNAGRKLKNFDVFLTKYIASVFFENTVAIKNYYASQKNFEPRVCITIPHKSKPSFKTYRNTEEQYDSVAKRYKHGLTTHSKHMDNRHELYMCNDIPKEVFENNYTHHRIDEAKIKNFTSLSELNENWNDVWIQFVGKDGSQLNNSHLSCYKSILTIPLSLPKKKLTKKFWEYIENYFLPKPASLENKIFGYLQIDSIEKDYFNKRSDIYTGHFFAEIISIYILIQIICTDASKTYLSIRDAADKTSPSKRGLTCSGNIGTHFG